MQQFGVGLGAFSTAALLYAGAAAVGAFSRRRVEREARIVRRDLPRLHAMAAFGAVIGPVALAWGLQNTSGTSESLMLTLEAPFTAVLAVGASGYGLSLHFYLLAQRAFGAARTGSVFAFAPFIGAAFAAVLGDRSASGMMAVGSMLMLAGVVLHLAESHGHEHEHEALEHEHAHRHEDGHHDHDHDPMPAVGHSHGHRHSPLRHQHPHVPDAHLGHRH